METLKNIVSRVFNVPANKINDELARDTIEEWDSFNHLLLISEVEKEIGIKFTILEVGKIKTLKELKESIAKKKKSL